LKTAWRESCHNFQVRNPHRVLTMTDFNKVFGEAWCKSMSLSNITSGYKVTGLYPFNPAAILSESTQVKAMSKPKTMMERTGLTYIPLYGQADHTPPEPKALEDRKVDCTYIHTSRQQSTISSILVKPIPPSALPSNKEKSSGLIVTSEENLRALNQKRLAKAEKERAKEEKRIARERLQKEKRIAREHLQEEKRVAKECHKKKGNTRQTAKAKKDVEAILVDEAQNTPPSVKPKWWLEKLKLPNSDLTRLQSGAKLTDTLMNAAQKLLLEQFPFCQSLQDVNLGTLLMFSEINSVDDAAVQILHTGLSCTPMFNVIILCKINLKNKVNSNSCMFPFSDTIQLHILYIHKYLIQNI
jgi:hypothetical protein